MRGVDGLPGSVQDPHLSPPLPRPLRENPTGKRGIIHLERPLLPAETLRMLEFSLPLLLSQIAKDAEKIVGTGLAPVRLPLAGVWSPRDGSEWTI